MPFRIRATVAGASCFPPRLRSRPVRAHCFDDEAAEKRKGGGQNSRLTVSLWQGQMEKVFLRVWKERSDGVGLREKNFQEGFYHRLLLEGDKHRCIRHRHVERSVQAASKQVALPASQHIHYILMQRRWVNAKIWVMLRKKTKKTKLQDWQITYRKHRWDSRKSITTTHRLAQKWQTVTVRKQHRNG